MSDRWIDRLAKSVASRDLNQSEPTPAEEPVPLSRRSLLGRAGAATAGGLAYLIPGMRSAHAGGCSGSRRKCGGRCVNTRTSERHCGRCNHRCDNDEVCSKGKCCKKGTTNCNGTCVDLKRNENNCGRCGRECGNNEVCSKGKCCPQGQRNCGGTCVNAQTDEQNCGTCGNSCSGDDVCVSGTCAPATCTDGIKNHGEADIDCGGPNCPGCQAGGDCLQHSDCQSGVCTSGICQAATCTDLVKNGDETDVDCGGPDCPDCANDKGCNTGTDCSSGVCTGGICQAATCPDLVKNGDETDVDCGGPDCPDCANDKNCLVGSDCASGVCHSGVCKVCVPGSQRSCYTGPGGTQNVGVCQAGTETCNGGGTAYGACLGQVTPSPEVCDGLDNDCDGITDEGAQGTGQACCGATGPNGACCNAGTTVCVGGTLGCSTGPCTGGTTCCPAGCVNTSIHVDNCGNCGVICAQVSNGGRGCQAGTCVITGCNPGWSNCDGQYGTGCETNTQVDVNNCGNCGVICAQVANSARTCSNGFCGFTCNTGFANCDGQSANGCETNTQTNLAHCGACNNACTGGDVCSFGECVPA